MPDGGFDLPNVRRGRGASVNVANRFERTHAQAFDDGWDTIADEVAAPPPVRTTLTRDATRTALAWNSSPDLGFDRAVNPYRGCEHGCIYCYARPTHAWLGLSPGLDFETQLVFKPEVAQLLERELAKPGYTPRPITLGSNTDPYQPIERTLSLTRSVLELLDRTNHPVSIVTKSAGVLRDLDILGRMAERKLVRVWLSVTTLDPELARRMEPRAATPQRRLAALRGLAEAGVPAGVLAAPMIPGLNDAELERILAAAKEVGAQHAGYVLLRLPLELRQMFETWLHQHYPQRARHVLNLVRETREGAFYQSDWGKRQTGTGPYAGLLAQRFDRALRKLGLTSERDRLETSLFVPPETARRKAADRQLELL